MAENKTDDITIIAQKRRYLNLFQAVNRGKNLIKSEIAELKQYESIYRPKVDNQPTEATGGKKPKITAKQQKFIDCWDGCIKTTAQKAGLTYVYCRKLATKRHIRELIRARQDLELKPEIANRQQRQKFWTDVLNDSSCSMRDRLKASELLGKSEADFTENQVHKFPEGCGVLLINGGIDKETWPQLAQKQQNQS
jgi:phage terminase small subunit